MLESEINEKYFIKFLKGYEKKSNLSLDLNLYREFQKFEEELHSEFNSYDDLPHDISYVMKCFTKLKLLGMALSLNESEKLNGAKSCLTHFMKEFNSDSAFTDGITIYSWFLFNFPVEPNGISLAQKILLKEPEFIPELEDFVREGVSSRLGLYELKISSKSKSTLKELITGNNVTINQPLETPPGDILLLRIIKINGKRYVFGDTNEFPSEKKEEITIMVNQKMNLYFPHADPKKSYDAIMRLAGPYWFSIVARDYNDEILDPDHYTTYYLQ